MPLFLQASKSLTISDDPIHQFAGLWIFYNLFPEAWDKSWLNRLDINTLGAVLESRYVKPKECLCPSPLCLHYHPPNTLQKFPQPKVIMATADALQQFAVTLQKSPNWDARWRGRLIAKVLGLYGHFASKVITDLLPDLPNRTAMMLVSVAFARIQPSLGLEHALSWLPKGSTPAERVLRALHSPEPLERSSALYVARGLPTDELHQILLKGFSDPLVFVRFASLRPMEDGFAYEVMERELLYPHEHKRLLHRCILNTMARADLERTLTVAKQVYLDQGKEMWRKDTWLRHDAGYILLRGVVDLGCLDLLDSFRQILEREPHPSPLVLLPAIQALLAE